MAGTGFNFGIQASWKWTQTITEREFVDSAVMGMQIAGGLAFAALLLSTQNLVIAFFAIDAIVGIVSSGKAVGMGIDTVLGMGMGMETVLGMGMGMETVLGMGMEMALGDGMGMGVGIETVLWIGTEMVLVMEMEMVLVGMGDHGFGDLYCVNLVCVCHCVHNVVFAVLYLNGSQFGIAESVSMVILSKLIRQPYSCPNNAFALIDSFL